MELSVRELQAKDIETIVDYFVDADVEYLRGMGADKSKLPKREEWIRTLQLEYHKVYEEKEFYYMYELTKEQI